MHNKEGNKVNISEVINALAVPYNSIKGVMLASGKI
jgi:hypothetical protein